MLTFTGSAKELFVTAGVAISCAVLISMSLFWMYVGQWCLVLALAALSMVAAVIKGATLGYRITRYLWRGVAFFSIVGGAINPFAYMDVDAARGSLLRLIGVCILVAAVACCLSYCVSEHAKLRRLDGADKWRSFP